MFLVEGDPDGSWYLTHSRDPLGRLCLVCLARITYWRQDKRVCSTCWGWTHQECRVYSGLGISVCVSCLRTD